MIGHVDASRDLLLGLYALEAGAVDLVRLTGAALVVARAPGRGLAEVLNGQGVDRAVLAQLEERVRSVLGPTEGAEETPETVAYTGPAHGPAAPISRGSGAPARYSVLRAHARGGLGEVFIAFDAELKRSVALKELQARLAHDPDSQARFLQEAEVTGSLEHPGIVPVYSLGRHPDGRPYYAMRFIEGETLGAAIARYHRGRAAPGAENNRELAFRRLLGSLVDACNAVAYAHSRGVVHRDLKPDNIMLGRFGETLVVDWGVAKPSPGGRDADERPAAAAMDDAADASMTRPGSVIGTPRYMSPEQAAGDLERVTPASDVYSLGAILYCLLVGQAPFPDSDLSAVLARVRRGIFPAPRRVSRSVDATLEAVCLKAMATNPDDRHASALELAGDLEAWQADLRYRVEQEHALRQTKGALARLCLERAHARLAHDELGEGKLWLARALEHAPPELDWMIRTSLAAWHVGGKVLERSIRHGGEVVAAALCPEGRRLATAGIDGTARIWDISAGAPLSPPLRHDGPVRAVAFHPDGDVLASAGDDGSIRLWDAVTGAPAGLLGHGGPITAMTFSPDGSKLAAVGGPAGFSLWSVAGRTPLCAPAGSGPRAVAAAFAPDGRTVAVSCDDGSVLLRDAVSGDILGPSLTHELGVPALEFDPGGPRLLTGCLDGHARLWDLDSGTLAASLPHQGGVQCVGFRPGGRAVATGCTDGTARLWDLDEARPIGEPLAHRARVDRLAFRPDGTTLATGSPDGTVRLWCAGTGLPIGPPLLQAGMRPILVFSPDGRRLATGGPDATARSWTLADPVDGSPERISCWIRVATELEFDEGDAIRRIDAPSTWDLRRRLDDLGGPPLR